MDTYISKYVLWKLSSQMLGWTSYRQLNIIHLTTAGLTLQLRKDISNIPRKGDTSAL